MNVAVLAPPSLERELIRALEEMKELGIPAFGLKIRKTWDKVTRQGLAARAERASHLLLVCAPGIVDEPWFLFMAGFALGKEARLALRRVDPYWEAPAYLQKVPLLDTDRELLDYYRIEREEWEAEESRRLARAALLELGISCHSESLAQCASDGDIHAVELFLKAGFNPDSRDKHGVPLLCLAARSRHIGVATVLLGAGASLDLQSEDRGYSALMDATLASSPELVELLLSKKADPDLVSKDGQTALVIAVGRGDAAIARSLLEAGANPDITDKLGFSARKYVALFRKPELIALLKDFPPR